MEFPLGARGPCLPSPREGGSSLGCSGRLHSERGSSECSQTRHGIALERQEQVSGVFLKMLEIRSEISHHGHLLQPFSSFPPSLFSSSVDVQRKPLEQKSQLGEREKGAMTSSHHLESPGLPRRLEVFSMSVLKGRRKGVCGGGLGGGAGWWVGVPESAAGRCRGDVGVWVQVQLCVSSLSITAHLPNSTKDKSRYSKVYEVF